MRHQQRAQATVWLVLVTMTLGLMFGLAADGTVLFAEHRRAEQMADSAARAAASVLDLAALRDAPDEPPGLDPAAAEALAVEYVGRHAPDAAVEPAATRETVRVRVHLRVATTIAHLPGESSVDVVGEGYAHPLAGLARPNS